MEAVLREFRDTHAAAVARQPIAPQQRRVDARVRWQSAGRLARAHRVQRDACGLHAFAIGDFVALRTPARVASQLVVVRLTAQTRRSALLRALLRAAAFEASAADAARHYRGAVVAGASSIASRSPADHRGGRQLVRRPDARPPAVPLRAEAALYKERLGLRQQRLTGGRR